MKFEETNRESKKCEKVRKAEKNRENQENKIGKARRTDLEVPNKKCFQVQSDGGEFYRSTVLLVADFMVTILVRLVGWLKSP